MTTQGRVWAALVAVLLLAASAFGQQVKHDPKDRVMNRGPACWYASAETAGRIQKIDKLAGLVDEVHSTKVGLHPQLGGRHPDFIYWAARRGVLMDMNRGRTWSQGAAWVSVQLDVGRPVILGLRNQHGQGHAVLLVELQKVGGAVSPDSVVTILDPDIKEPVRVPFRNVAWDGAAYVFLGSK